MKHNRPIIRLWRISHGKYLIFIQILLKFYLTYASIYVSILAKNILDHNIFLSQPGRVIINFSLIGILGIAASFLLEHAKNAYAINLSCQLKELGIKKLFQCSYDYLEKDHSGTIINKLIHDVDNTAEYMAGGFPEFMGSAISFVFSFVYLLSVNWSMLLVCSVCIPLTLWVTKKLAAPTYHTMENFESKMDELTSMAKDTVVNPVVEKTYNLQPLRQAKFDRAMDQATSFFVEYERFVAKASPMRYLMNSAPALLCIMTGFINACFGRITGGEFIAFFLLLEHISTPLSNFIGYVTDYKTALVSIDRILEVLDSPDEKSGDYAPSLERTEAKEEACYEIKNLNFAYGDTPVLKDVNCTIKNGHMTAFVGTSGSGKSTLFKLLAGFYPADSGMIAMYGRSLRDWNLKALRSHIAYVEQSTYLFNGTMEENIRAGCQNAAFDEVVEAAKMAYAHDFIMEMPNGYQTLLSEGGNNLSGGQRQRIAIARAFLKKAPVLLLDEMTSALDGESERLIQKAIENYQKDRTVIIIAHRLQTIKHADQIFVLQNGRIAESGTHDELIRLNHIYHSLYTTAESEGLNP